MADPAPSTGYHNIDSLPLGSLLQVKQQGRAKRTPGLVKRLLKKGFK